MVHCFRHAGGFIGVIVLLLSAVLAPAPGFAVTEAEQTFLNFYFTPDELHVVSTTRSLKSINRVAENVQVVSAADIALIQAHSLAEVLETVTGLAIENRGGPGTIFFPYIQGSRDTHVAAFLDGIPLNNLGGNFPELTFFAVEEIERIEVVKGPASSAWGSALGGVINIITKNPPEQPGHAGSVSASAGRAGTNDFRAQVAGRAGGLGYALTAGRFDSAGLADGFDVARTTVTTKLSYRPAPAWNLGFALYYTGSDRGDGHYRVVDRNEADHLRAQLAADGFLAGGFLSLNLWGAHNDDTYIKNSLSDGTAVSRNDVEEKIVGGGLRYRRSFTGHEVVVGGDYKSGSSDQNDPVASTSVSATEQKWALFVNDTFDVGSVTVTAGLRRDNLQSAGTFWSPSLGAVTPLGRHLLLRLDVSQGFSTPFIGADTTSEVMFYQGNPDLKPEKVLSYQGGVEGDVPGLFWYKLTLFRHDVEDGLTSETVDEETETWTYVNRDSVRRQGGEIDVRSVAFHGVALEGGATLTDSENRTSGNESFWFADSTYRFGLSYTGSEGLKALLHVHHTHWDAPSRFNPAADPIVDLHISQKIPLGGLHLELFGSAHNLFEGKQYFYTGFPNPGRWLEAGLRCSF